MTDNLYISCSEFSRSLDRIDNHIESAGDWADKKFQRFPNISEISMQFGMNFGIQFTVSITWQRKEKTVKVGNAPVTSLGIPSDIVDKCKEIEQTALSAGLQLKIEAEDLVRLCVEHTTEAARSWLDFFKSKLTK